MLGSTHKPDGPPPWWEYVIMAVFIIGSVLIVRFGVLPWLIPT